MTTKNKKSDFYKNNKKIFNIDDIDDNKILVSKRRTLWQSNSLIYVIGYNDNDVIRPLCLKLSKMTGYINKDNNKNKKTTITMSLRVNNEHLLKNIIKYGKKLRS